MRLRTFTARTMPEAMALVRAQLGGEAIILSTARANGGECVREACGGVEEPTDPEQLWVSGL